MISPPEKRREMIHTKLSTPKCIKAILYEDDPELDEFDFYGAYPCSLKQWSLKELKELSYSIILFIVLFGNVV